MSKKDILENCVRELRRNMHGSKNSARARFIADIIESAVQNGEYDRAELILHDQMSLINSNDYESESKPIYRENPRSKYIRTTYTLNHQHQYYMIVLKYLRQLVAYCGTVELNMPGIALTHRIWVGKALSSDQIANIKSANIRLEQIWINSETNNKEPLTHCIWTNRRELIGNSHIIEGVVFRDIESLFDPYSEIYKHYLSFMAHQEYAFVSDLARVQACCKYGGLFMGIAWQNNFRCNPQKFIPTMNTVKVYSSVEDQETIITLPFAGTAYEELEGYLLHQYRNFSMRYVTKCYVDSEMLYFGRPRHPLVILLEQKQLQYLESFGKSRVPHVVKNYRENMYEKLIKDWAKYAGKKPFSEYVSDKIRGGQVANIGLVINVLALTQTLMDFGYYHFNDPTENETKKFRLIVLNEQIKFHINYVKEQIFCETLGLQRKSSMSWLKVDLSKRMSSEI